MELTDDDITRAASALMHRSNARQNQALEQLNMRSSTAEHSWNQARAECARVYRENARKDAELANRLLASR